MNPQTRIRTFTPSQARRLALACQGLSPIHLFGKGKKGVVAAIKQIGYIQIDTISVVERAHHHVLWARIPGYSPDHLNGLMNKKSGLFEYWSHAAAFLPMDDFRFSLVRKQRFLDGDRLWFPRNHKIVQHVYDRVKAEGPLSARDFEDSPEKPPSGWWNWKPAKQALEQLFHEGSLMVRERKGFQKFYDLTERVLPNGVDQRTPTQDEFAEYLIRIALTAHGLATLPEICYLRGNLRKQVASALDRMIEAGAVCTARIKGVEGVEYYGFRDRLHETEYRCKEEIIQILSPFDTAVIQRNRLKTVFGFEYLFECYVPTEKRRYGYFSLPLLWKDTFIGMIDCKAHRQKRVLEVLSMHILYKKPIPNLRELLEVSLQSFAAFNNCSQVTWKTGLLSRFNS